MLQLGENTRVQHSAYYTCRRKSTHAPLPRTHHAVHVPAFAPEKRPMGQSAQVVAVELEYFPAAHSVHDPAPGPLNLPAWHGACVADADPAAQ
jgi:hypothetical protein